MSRTKKNRRFQYANQHASIQTRPNLDAQIGGETFLAGREDDLRAYIGTRSDNSTGFELSVGSASISLTGRQARTIQRLLNKHYASCNSVAFDNTPGASV